MEGQETVSYCDCTMRARSEGVCVTEVEEGASKDVFGQNRICSQAKAKSVADLMKHEGKRMD